MGFVMEPAYSAVGSLGGSVAIQNMFENGWTGNRDFDERVQLSRFAWASLEPQWLDTLGTRNAEFDSQVNNWRRARTTNLKIGFASGQWIGMTFESDRSDYCSDKSCTAQCWRYHMESNGSTVETVKVTLGSTAPFDCREQCQSHTGCNYWTLITLTGDCILKSDVGELKYRNDAISGIPNCVPDLSETVNSFGHVADGTHMSFWPIYDFKTGAPGPMTTITTPEANTTKEPWYLPQAQLAKQGRPLTGAWSNIHVHNDNVAIAWTIPVAYCGDYSCLDGVIATTIGLAGVSYDAFGLWLAFRDRLSRPPYEFPIGSDNSSMFIVSRKARSPGQEGLLVGCSDGCPGVPGADDIRDMLHIDGQLPYAANFSNPAVTATSRAILQRFGTWSNRSLDEHQMFTFWPKGVDHIFEPGEGCLAELDQAGLGGECWQASTISVRLDEATAWLVVLVLPAASFAQKSSEVARNATLQVQWIDRHSAEKVTSARRKSLCVALAVLLLSACLGTCLGLRVSSRLEELTDLTQRLSNLDFTQPSKLKVCLISDVINLQQAFCSLTRGIQAFARFVPEPVVLSLVHGQNIQMEEREVTILSSDIEDFTKISKALGHLELLFMLTRYLSVMQRVVQMYKGVVAEILGDGLLIYWNAPDDVEKPAELACAAAVLMQEKVMDLLNDEFSSIDLPRIRIRIGIHTALVSSGTVGSEMKKKFGVLGPGVDIANHLESSCKVYQKQTLVSERTMNALSPDSGFSFMEVGSERIEGEDEPMKIYELISRDWSPRGDLAEESGMPSALEGLEKAAVTPVAMEATQTASRLFGPPDQHQSPGSVAGMVAVRSRRSRRAHWQGDEDAAQAVAESGESLQRNSALFSNEGMLELLQSTSSVASLSGTMSMASQVYV
ncbi:unnamed protein product [Prorocentrum cordatum]|uniref:Guanylate cyclase domain-containing protein n=1 Tax=Prorocentrum cordatum TaxID=2364126 RepID=A0ABN9VS24_9DINO|nr:unnamed protein product [Polarella glacialis]